MVNAMLAATIESVIAPIGSTVLASISGAAGMLALAGQRGNARGLPGLGRSFQHYLTALVERIAEFGWPLSSA